MDTLRNVKARDLRRHIPQNIEREIINRNIHIIGMLSKENEEMNQKSLQKFDPGLPLSQMMESAQRQNRTHHELIKTFNGVHNLSKTESYQNLPSQQASGGRLGRTATSARR